MSSQPTPQPDPQPNSRPNPRPDPQPDPQPDPKPELIIPDQTTWKQRVEELVSTGVMTELRTALTPSSNAGAGVADSQQSLIRVAHRSETANDYATRIATASNPKDGLLTLKGAVCINTIGKLRVPVSQDTPILFSTSYEHLAEGLLAAVRLQAEALSWSGIPVGYGATVIAIVSFYDSTTTKAPDHASVELSVARMPVEPPLMLSISAQRITTFGTSRDSGLVYYKNIMQVVRTLKPTNFQFPENKVAQGFMPPIMAPDLDHHPMLDADEGFAFVLDRAINLGNGAEKALKDYIVTFASHAMSEPVVAAFNEDG